MPEKRNVKKEDVIEQQQAGSKKAALIYMGPAIAGVAVPGTVYRNGLTPQLKKVKEEIPAIARLLVETRRTAQMRKDLMDPQSAASICYKNVSDYVKKGAIG